MQVVNKLVIIQTLQLFFQDSIRIICFLLFFLQILIALKAYELGKSGPVEERRFFFLTPKKENKRPKPDNPYNWRPNREILTALDKGFYLSFKVFFVIIHERN